jgi:hypothetical protein
LAWSGATVGTLAKWPQGLKTAARIMLTAPEPTWIGKDLLSARASAHSVIRKSWRLRCRIAASEGMAGYEC